MEEETKENLEIAYDRFVNETGLVPKESAGEDLIRAIFGDLSLPVRKLALTPPSARK